MLELIVAAVIVITIMFLFVFIILKNILKKINENSKKYFINKMETFDYILEEKTKKLEEVKNNIEELEEKEGKSNIVKQELKKDEEIKKREQNKNEKEIKIEFKMPEYREEEFFKNYRNLRKIFNIDPEKIVEEFAKSNKDEAEEKKYNKIKKIREKFDDEAIYQCMTLNKKQQISILEEVLTAGEKKTIQLNKIIEEDEGFDTQKLIDTLDKKIDSLDPTIHLYVNYMDKKLEKIDKRIKLEQYNNMSEGIIIKYRNKIYDYSI